MRLLGTALVLLYVGSLSGCTGASANKAVEAASTPQYQSNQVGRFQAVSQSFGVALDTKTGQLCRTFPNARPDTGIAAKNGLDEAPLCVELST